MKGAARIQGYLVVDKYDITGHLLETVRRRNTIVAQEQLIKTIGGLAGGQMLDNDALMWVAGSLAAPYPDPGWDDPAKNYDSPYVVDRDFPQANGVGAVVYRWTFDVTATPITFNRVYIMSTDQTVIASFPAAELGEKFAAVAWIIRYELSIT